MRRDWLTVREMERTMSDVVHVYCTVISRNYGRGTEENKEVSQTDLGTSIHRTGRILNTRQKWQAWPWGEIVVKYLIIKILIYWQIQGNKHLEIHKSQKLSQHIWMIGGLGITCCHQHQSKWWSLQTVTKYLFAHLYHKPRVTFFTISVLSNKFSPPIPLAFWRLPYTDDRNYKPHLQLIYLWWPQNDRESVCPIYSRPYLLIINYCKYPRQTCKCKAVLCSIVGVEVQSHTFINFGTVRMKHWLF